MLAVSFSAAHSKRMSRLSPRLLTVIVFAVFSSVGQARDWHATPQGSGIQDGSALENAVGAKGLQALLDKLQPGDRLLFGAGEYRDLSLVLRASGTAQAPIVIAGQAQGERPVFSSSWTIENKQKGPTAFAIAPGVSHVTVRDLQMRGYQHGIRGGVKPGETPRAGWAFHNVDMTHIRHGFYFSGFTGLKLTDCDLARYSKHGFRLDAACEDVVFQNCTADCSEGDAQWEHQTEELPVGFVVNDSGAPNRNVTFDRCLARNNLMPLQKNRYKNGDGFVVEGNTENVLFRRCRSIRNQDGGYDLKVKDVRLEDCVAMENKRDYRIWTTGTLTNCFSGWSQGGIWTKGGPVIAERCTIAAWKSAPVQTEDANVGVELVACILAADAGKKPDPAHMKLAKLRDCVEADTLEAAGLQPPDGSWEGLGPALDSKVHTNRGYRAPKD